MNRRTVLIGTSAIGIAAFAGGALVLTRNRQAEADTLAAAAPAVETDMLVRVRTAVQKSATVAAG